MSGTRDSGDSGRHDHLDPNMIKLEPLGSARELELEPLGGGNGSVPEQESGPSSADVSYESLELEVDGDDSRPAAGVPQQDSGTYEPQTTDLLPVNPPPLPPSGQETVPMQAAPSSSVPVPDEPPRADLATEVQRATATVGIDRSADEEIQETEAVILVRRSFWETTEGAAVVALTVSFVIGALVALYYIRSLYPDPITEDNLISPALHAFMVWLITGIVVAPITWFGYFRIVE